ncbi:MAG TPA: hypothetical protein VHA34_13100, partial [Actinomycetes bacterium]|nr:hypothetical protein [Actinomycetes bacterium]
AYRNSRIPAPVAAETAKNAPPRRLAAASASGIRARLAGPDGTLVPEGHGPVADVRYLDVVPLPEGGHRLWYEAPLPDGSHELRTELIAAEGAD